MGIAMPALPGRRRDGEPYRGVAILRKLFRELMAAVLFVETISGHISAAEKPGLAARKIAVTNPPSVCRMRFTSS
jgi:hypothetical protein